jgi:hypothetical protein
MVTTLFSMFPLQAQPAVGCCELAARWEGGREGGREEGREGGRALKRGKLQHCLHKGCFVGMLEGNLGCCRAWHSKASVYVAHHAAMGV